MALVAIRAEGLAKEYRIGLSGSGPRSLKEMMSGVPHRLRNRATQVPQVEPQAFWALRDVSFEVGVGETLGMVGPNGAGKSTLLKILARIVRPSLGRAAVRGRLGALIEVGTGFHHDLTGRENIFLNGAILGMRHREVRAKLDAIVDFAGIETFLDTPVKRYSSGMYMRLAFAVAAHLDPDILIIDEVLSVGDAAFQRKCIAKAEESVSKGSTVLFVSHQMSLVQRVCSRAILIDSGRLTADGPTADVVARYLKSLETQALLPVRDRRDRAGRGEKRLVGMGATGESGTLVSGGRATIRLEVEGARGPTQCMVTLYDEAGDVAVTFDTIEGSAADVPHGGDAFEIDIPALLLRPGRYRVDVALLTGPMVEDHLESAMVMQVGPGLVGDRPALARNGFGSVVLPHSWRLRT